jgi:hypothetical protein
MAALLTAGAWAGSAAAAARAQAASVEKASVEKASVEKASVEKASVEPTVFGFETGTEGWAREYGPMKVGVTTARAYRGTRSLSLQLTGAGNPAVNSPGDLVDYGAGTTVDFHVYEPAGASLQAAPFSEDGAWDVHFAPLTSLRSGGWSTLALAIPDLKGGLRYVGLQIDNGGGVRTTLEVDQVGPASSAARAPAPAGSQKVKPTAGKTATAGKSIPAGKSSGASKAASGKAQVASTKPPVPDGPAGTWHLAFDDEFNGNSLNADLKTPAWAPYWFANGDSSNGTTMASSNVSVSGGYLHLAMASNGTGALVSTNPDAGGGFQFSYGYAEARIYLPGSGDSIDDWPAWWTDGQSWPADGEMDILEGMGGQACWHFHSDAGGPGSCAAGDYTGWHTYGADWEPGKVTYYYDGVDVGTIATGITSSPMYLLLENSDGQYSGPLVKPTDMLVDYVRVWQH